VRWLIDECADADLIAGCNWTIRRHFIRPLYGHRRRPISFAPASVGV